MENCRSRNTRKQSVLYDNNRRQTIRWTKLLECSIDYLLGFSDDFGSIALTGETKKLSADEESLLKYYRALSQGEKQQVRDYTDFLVSKNKK